MPVDMSKYPDNWKEIRARILKRAGNRCEGSPLYPDCRAENGKPHPETGSKVVLTIAHLNHDVAYNEDSDLRALCQKCHLAHDLKLHMANSWRTRQKKKGQLLLFEEDVIKNLYVT